MSCNYCGRYGQCDTIFTQELYQLKTSTEKQLNELKTSTEQQLNELKTIIAELQKKNSRLTELQEVIMADKSFKDFTINVGKKVFKVHKALFAASVPTVFQMLKDNPDAEQLNLCDISESTFQVVYDFVYNETLPTAEANNFEIFAAATRLKIDTLAATAAAHLIATMNVENSFERLVLGNKFDHIEISKKAFEIIRTKIFPDRKLDDDLAKQTEKLKKIIEAKKKLDKEFEGM
jgi:hypothetical protein